MGRAIILTYKHNFMCILQIIIGEKIKILAASSESAFSYLIMFTANSI